MSRPAQESERLFNALASSGSILPALVDHWKQQLEDETVKLNDFAVNALLRPDMLVHGQVQFGRVQMLKEQIEHAERFYNSKER